MALTKATLIDLNSNELILDLDADTSITADTDDTIHFKIAGADEIVMTGTALTPAVADGSALGSTALEWSDLFLADSATIQFGADQDVTLTHVADSGLALKSTATGDDKPVTLVLQTGETDIAANDVLGVLNFQAPDENTGTDAILVAAGIAAVSEGDFSSSANATKLSFRTAVSAAASETMSLTSNGDLFLAGGLIDLKNDGNAVSQIKFYCESSNAHAQTLIGAPHSQSATNTLTLPDGNNGVLLSTVSTATVTNKTFTSPKINEDVAVTSTATEINLIDGGATIGTTAIADGDGIIHNDGGTMKVTTAATFKTYFQEGLSSNTPSSADGQALGSASLEWSDLFLADAGTIQFGNDQDIILTHDADVGLKLKHSATADDKPIVLTLQTGETDMAANDVMGAIRFQAPDEGTGTDAVLVAAAIQAVSEGDFSSSNNATRLEFHTGASEAASSKMTLSSAGLLTIADDLVIKDGGTIGVASDADAITIASNGAVTFTQTPVFPDGSIAVADLDIDGATDIGADIVDADLFIIDDGAGGTNRKTTASRVKTYIGAVTTLGGLTDVSMDIANFTDSLLIQTNSDGSAPGTGTLSQDAIGNIGIGKNVFAALTTGDYNIGIGHEALDSHTTSSYALAIGAFAMSSSTSADSLAIGGSALNACDTEQDNIAIGHHAMKLANSGAEDNVVIGHFAGDAITSGDTNTLQGHAAGGAITTGSGNNCFGGGAGASLTTGDYNIIIGNAADVGAVDMSNGIIIGHNIATTANKFAFGKSGDVVSNTFSSDANWSRSSDRRKKREIYDQGLGLDFINDLRTVNFQWKPQNEFPKEWNDYNETSSNDTEVVMHGFIAQEVKEALDKNASERDKNFTGWSEGEDGMQHTSREMFVIPLIKAVQELSAEVKELKAKLENK